MTERDPKTAGVPAPAEPEPERVVHRVIESERSLVARARSSAPPRGAGETSAPAQPVPRETLRMYRPERPPEVSASVAPPSAPPPPRAPYGSTTLIMAAPIRATAP